MTGQSGSKGRTPSTSEATGSSGDPYLGRVIAAQFRVQRLLGSGATSRVYLAEQLGASRHVALKILQRDLLRDENAVARLKREATIGRRLRHPNIAEVSMLGYVENTPEQPGGEPFLVLEYLEGMLLSTALERAGGAIGVVRAVHVALQLCEAAGEAHGQGIVHRDIKPENVMLVRRGADSDFVKLLDFGTARSDQDADFATREGAVLGSARYLAPEGAQGGRVGPEADVYAIATLLFQCIAGRTPFDGPNAVSILVQQVSAPAPDLRSFSAARNVPAALADLVFRNLAKDPLERCPNARSLGAELRACAFGGHDDTTITARLDGGRRA